MSKLTSFTSASDALIEPTGATAGQTLIWDAVSQTFTPQTPATPALAANSVDSSKIVDGSIQTIDVADSAITGQKIAPNTITFDNIADETIISSKLQNGGITAAKMGVNSVSSSNIIDGTIQNEDIGAGQIGLDKLAPIPPTTLVGLGVLGSPAAPTNITLGTNLSMSGNTLNAAGGSSLPDLTDLRGLRGDGTGVPVADARLQYGAANAATIDFNLSGSNGIRLSSVGGNNLITNAGTASGTPLTIRTQDSAAGTNSVPGDLNLSTGRGTGSASASIVFSTCLPTTSGLTVTNPTQVWTMGQDAFAATLTANRVGGGGIIQAVSNESLNVRTVGTGSLALSPIGSGALNIGAAGTGVITVGATTKTTSLFGIVKKPTMAYLKTTATANTAVAANTNTVIAFPAGVTNGTGISQAANTFTLTRVGFYSIKLKVSFQSATTNVRGVTFLAASTVIFAGVAPQKAFRTSATANANEEIEAAWDVQVTAAGNFTVQINSLAAGTVNLTNGFAGTTEITILEIG